MPSTNAAATTSKSSVSRAYGPLQGESKASMDLGLDGKTAVVTAASGGLGAAIAEALAAEGARVVVSARNADRLARVAAGIAARTGGEVRAVPADVTDARAVDGLVAEADSRHGGIDVLVANSGGAATAPFAEMTDDGWRAAMEVKVLAQIRLAREAFKRMTARGAGGRIVFVAGTHGRQPHAHAVTAGFCNAALQNVSKALAEEGGPHGILANVVNPGPFATERMVYLAERKAEEDGTGYDDAVAALTAETVLKRYGRPEELAAFVAFLASAQASYATGAMFDIDGGQVKAL